MSHLQTWPGFTTPRLQQCFGIPLAMTSAVKTFFFLSIPVKKQLKFLIMSRQKLALYE